jgi:capsular polysaccharide biosynthesis protein
MELRDYLAVLRRYWTIWVGVTLAAVAVALIVVLSTTPTYSARATVYVAAAGADETSGAQFIERRVTSYPDVARSEAVLGPVIADMGLDVSVADLRSRVSADSPLESSQIDITVSDTDAERVAATTNAIAGEFRRTVEELESPAGGDSPVSLTVTDPANVPSDPVSPQAGLFLGLGLVVGLALGAAAAVLRSRTDKRVHTEDDVRSAWGDGGGDVAVLTSPRQQRRAGRLAGGPSSLVARRLAVAAGSTPVRAVVLGVDPEDDHQVARTFAQQVSRELVDGGVSADVTGAVGGPAKGATSSQVQLSTATPRVPLAEWRSIAERYDGVVLVAESGRVDGADLREIRAILTTAGARLLAVVLLPRRSSRLRVGRRTAAAPQVRTDLVRAREKIALGKG